MPVLRCLTLECADDVDAAGFLRANGSHCQDLKIRNAANTGRLIALCPRLEVLHLAYIVGSSCRVDIWPSETFLRRSS